MLYSDSIQSWKEFQGRVEARIQVAMNHHHPTVAYEPPIDMLGHTMDNMMDESDLNQAPKGSSSQNPQVGGAIECPQHEGRYERYQKIRGAPQRKGEERNSEWRRIR